MEWLTNHWYLFFAGIIAWMIILVRKMKILQERSAHDGHHGTKTGGNPHTGHGCCG